MAITTAPTQPPMTPAEYGWISTGMRTRWPASPALRWATVRGETLTGCARWPTGRMGTGARRSTGRSSRNQPTAPRKARIRPTTLTAAWVTSPVQSNVMPHAVIIGHGVGAGSSIISGNGSCCCSGTMASLLSPLPLLSHSCACRLAAYNVHHRKDDDPDRVHEVPVPRNHLEVLRVCLAHLAGEAEGQDQGEQGHAHDHVRGVEANERVERGAE